jgi:hypothetical protein
MSSNDSFPRYKGLQAFRPDLVYSIDRDSYFQRESANICIQNCVTEEEFY